MGMEGRTISDLFINEQIRDREVRVIGENGEQLGVMPTRDAMKLAEEAGVDLVKIAPTAKPPVCKIVDYGKFKYEQTRKEKEARKKQKTVEIKEIRLSPNIDTNDHEGECRQEVYHQGRQGEDYAAFSRARDGAYEQQQAYPG